MIYWGFQPQLIYEPHFLSKRNEMDTLSRERRPYIPPIVLFIFLLTRYNVGFISSSATCQSIKGVYFLSASFLVEIHQQINQTQIDNSPIKFLFSFVEKSFIDWLPHGTKELAQQFFLVVIKMNELSCCWIQKMKKKYLSNYLFIYDFGGFFE